MNLWIEAAGWAAIAVGVLSVFAGMVMAWVNLWIYVSDGAMWSIAPALALPVFIVLVVVFRYGAI